jgi:hypothetical protein
MANMAIPGRTPGPGGASLAPTFGAPTSQGSLHRDLQGVVSRALSAARSSGRDYLGQTEAAARAVMAVRPDLTFSEANRAVDWVRDHG